MQPSYQIFQQYPEYVGNCAYAEISEDIVYLYVYMITLRIGVDLNDAEVKTKSNDYRTR